MKKLQLHSEITQVFLFAPNCLFRTFFNFPGVIFNRRRTLDYDTFDSFTTDLMYCCFVQYIFQTSDGPDDEEFSLVCDCQEGVQGRDLTFTRSPSTSRRGNGNNPYSHYLQITGCTVFTEIFQEALIGTYIPQYLMTNDSFSSQTWAISVPNRNSDVKSISWPTGPPRVRSQNKGYWQYSTI